MPFYQDFLAKFDEAAAQTVLLCLASQPRSNADCITHISQPERTNAPECESKTAYSTMHWINSVANTNECANKPLSGVFLKAAFVVTLNSLRSAGSTHDVRCSGTQHEHSQPCGCCTGAVAAAAEDHGPISVWVLVAVTLRQICTVNESLPSTVITGI